jgi:hypothetical protein
LVEGGARAAAAAAVAALRQSAAAFRALAPGPDGLSGVIFAKAAPEKPGTGGFWGSISVPHKLKLFTTCAGKLDRVLSLGPLYQAIHDLQASLARVSSTKYTYRHT